MSFGKTYSPSAAAAEVMLPLDPRCQERTSPGTGPSITVGVHTHVPVQHGCGEEEPQYSHAWLHSAEAASLQGQPGMQFSPPPSFSKGPFLSSPPPHSTSPFPHVTGIQGKYFSQTLWSGVSPPAFRRPLYQARSRRAGQTLPQGHRESGLGA